MTLLSSLPAALFALALASVSWVSVLAEEKPLTGLAVKYPGDTGIEKDPDVIFAENFEEPSLDAMKKRWETVNHAEIMSFSDDTPPGSGGKRSLLMAQV